jgi:hypothetical protein
MNETKENMNEPVPAVRDRGKESLRQVVLERYQSFQNVCDALYALRPEMEFLDINLTKDSSLFLHAFDSPFYRQILQKTILYFGF